MTTGKTIALTRWTFVGKVMSLLLNMLSRLVITFLPKSKCLLISWLQTGIYFANRISSILWEIELKRLEEREGSRVTVRFQVSDLSC